MSARKGLMFVLVLLLLAATHVWAGPEPETEESVTLEVWIQSAHSHEAATEGVASAFAATWAEWEVEHPEIELELSLLPRKDALSEKLFASAAAGLSPDVVQFAPEWGKGLVDQDFLQPVDGLFDDEYLSDFAQGTLDYLTIDGKLYGLPFYVGTTLLFYRQSHLDEVGVDVPTTWDEFFEAGEKLKAAGRWGYAFSGLPGNYSMPALLSIFWGFGGELVDSDGNPVFFEGKNAEALIRAYNFYNDAVNVYGISPEDSVGFDDRTSQAMIFADEVSIWTANHAMISIYGNTRPDMVDYIRAAAFPMPDGFTSQTSLTQWSYGIGATDEVQRAAAATLLEKLTSAEHLIRYAPGYLSIIPRASVMAQAPAELQTPVYAAAAQLVQERGRPTPLVSYYPKMQELLTRGISEVILGEKTPEEVIENAKEEILAEL